MTDKNNAVPAAQPIKTHPFDLAQHLRTPEEMAEYLIGCAEYGARDAGFMRKAVNDVVAAALKLRAPVADERAAFEAKFPLPLHCQWIGNGYAATEYNAWDAGKHEARFEGWQARAALASAPVVGEAVYTLRVRGAIQAWTPTAAAFSIPDGEHQLFLSPAAPQASEAVRNAALCEAERALWSMRSRPEFEPDESDKLLDRAMASIRALKTQADKDDGCARSHPHENMSPECEAKTIQTRADNAAACRGSAKGTAECSCPSGDGSLHWPCAAHQQKSK